MDTTNEIGYVTSSRDFLVYLDGFPSLKINDMVQSIDGQRGWVNSLEEDQAEVLMLDEGKVTPTQQFIRLPDRLGVTVGDFLLGRAINPLGVPIDGKGLLSKQKNDPILSLDQPALGIESRQFISQQFVTGITLIDSLIPIGKGQRELVLGDAHSGKTGFIIDTIINQKTTGVICIVATIGKPSVVVRNLIDILRHNKALDNTIIVATSSSEPPPLIFLTPKTAFTIAEYFQKKGKDVLLILDDLGTHAKIYREMSLLGNKSPGRESYPGDIFYQHAHLLERAGNFLPQYGGGSITALPVMELNLSDFTTLIPTNLMSMTDGHLLFRASLHSQGQSPAVDISLSVSRVGRQTQDAVSNLLSAKIREILFTGEELETMAKFSSEMSAETQITLIRRELINELLKQDPLTSIAKEVQLILLALPFTSFMKDKNRRFIEKYKSTLIEAFSTHPQLTAITRYLPNFKTDDELIQALESAGAILSKLCP